MIQPFTSAYLKRAAHHIVSALEAADVRRWPERRRRRAARDAAEQAMVELPRQPLAPELAGDVLVDGMFDNPNYWFRYSFLRSALGLADANEVGLVGEFNRGNVRRTFANLGIRRIVDYPALQVSRSTLRAAANLASRTKSPEAILDWHLPGGFPGKMAYDAILKRQRLPAVSVQDPSFSYWTRELFACMERSQRLLDSHDFKFVSISHPFSFHWGSINWFALQRGIPVVLPFGAFGSIRAARLFKPEDVYAYLDRPRAVDLLCLTGEQQDELTRIGRSYIFERLNGKAVDLASLYAFRAKKAVDKATLCAQFGWDPAKPIVALYASNWFDWPHQLGMSQFRDFLDWTETTVATAAECTEFNWLFKPHPCEEWFGGVGLASLLGSQINRGHMRLTDEAWSSASILDMVDAIVTYHGTIGIEAAVMGKPVLVPDRGKYDDIGFVMTAADRSDYIRLLGTRWWGDMDMEKARRSAELFAGWWFCVPEWQGDALLGEDAKQDALYSDIRDFQVRHPTQVAREIIHLRDWYFSGHPYSHTYKMLGATAYRLSNV